MVAETSPRRSKERVVRVLFDIIMNDGVLTTKLVHPESLGKNDVKRFEHTLEQTCHCVSGIATPQYAELAL